MKAMLTSTLALLLAVVFFAGCAPTSSTSASDAPPSSVSVGVSEPSAAPVPDATSALPHSIHLQSVNNARELGGYTTADGKTIRSGLLLRTGALDELSAEDLSTLLDTYHLRDVVDFRSPDEVEEAPGPAMDGVTLLVIPLRPDTSAQAQSGTADEEQQAESDAAGEESAPEAPVYTNKDLYMIQAVGGDMVPILTGMYMMLVSNEYSASVYRQFFDVLLEDADGAVLWHCTAGKDRTGLAAALLLTALGVDKETIIADYMLTNDYVTDHVEECVQAAAKETDDPQMLEQVRIMNGVDRAFMEAAFATMEAQYGSAEGYLKQAVGLTEDEIATLREKYLE